MFNAVSATSYINICSKTNNPVKNTLPKKFKSLKSKLIMPKEFHRHPISIDHQSSSRNQHNHQQAIIKILLKKFQYIILLNFPKHLRKNNPSE